jgi:hypothetical protein
MQQQIIPLIFSGNGASKERNAILAVIISQNYTHNVNSVFQVITQLLVGRTECLQRMIHSFKRETKLGNTVIAYIWRDVSLVTSGYSVR